MLSHENNGEQGGRDMKRRWVVCAALWALLTAQQITMAKTVQAYPPPEAEAYFRLYQDADLTQEIGSPIGGIVYVALYIRLGPATRVHENTGSITVTVTDEYPDYWEGTDVDRELGTFGVGAGSGWDRKAEDDTSWTTDVGGPGYGLNNLSVPVFYRRKVMWNTMTTPWGNNGPHSLAGTAVWFVGAAGGDPFEGGPGVTTAETENVYITDVECSNGTIDYFKWDPDGEPALQRPVLSFDIRDADPHKYEVTVVYVGTGDGDLLWTMGEKLVVPELSEGSQTIDLADAGRGGHLDPRLHCRGPYTYDIQVKEYEGETPPAQGGLVIDDYAFKLPSWMYVPYGLHEVFLFLNGSHQNEVRCKYWLEHDDLSAQHAQNVTLTAMDEFLSERGTVSGPTELHVWHCGTDEDGDAEPDGIPVFTVPDNEVGQDWRVIWSALDPQTTYSTDRRTHDAVSMPAMNDGNGMAPVHVWLDLSVDTEDPPYNAYIDGQLKSVYGNQVGIGMENVYVHRTALDVGVSPEVTIYGADSTWAFIPSGLHQRYHNKLQCAAHWTVYNSSAGGNVPGDTLNKATIAASPELPEVTRVDFACIDAIRSRTYAHYNAKRAAQGLVSLSEDRMDAGWAKVNTVLHESYHALSGDYGHHAYKGWCVLDPKIHFDYKEPLDRIADDPVDDNGHDAPDLQPDYLHMWHKVYPAFGASSDYVPVVVEPCSVEGRRVHRERSLWSHHDKIRKWLSGRLDWQKEHIKEEQAKPNGTHRKPAQPVK